MTSITDQVESNTQLFLTELWKQSGGGQEVVDISITELDKIQQEYKYIVKAYLVYLQQAGCIAYDCFGGHYLIAVKRKEVNQ